MGPSSAASPSGPFRSGFLPLAAAGLLAALAYANTLGNPFVWDDRELIVEQPFVHDLANLPRLLAALPTQAYFEVSGEFYYRPLVTSSYIVDWALSGPAPVGFHFTNMLLHIFCALLVTHIGTRLGGARVGAVAGVLFAAHPIHTEAVTLITGRVDLWPTLGALGGCAAFLRARERDRPWPWLGVGVVAYGLGLLGKEIAFTLPAVLLLWEWGRATPPRSVALVRAWRWHLPFWVVAGLYATLRFAVLEPPAEAPPWLGGTPLRALASSVPIVVQYLGLVVWPARLSLYHNLHIVTRLGDWRFLGALLLLVGLTLCAWRLRRRAPLVLGGWLAFLITLSPVLNLVPIKNPMAERYLYLPSAPLCLAVGALIGLAVEAAAARGHLRRPALALGLVLVAALGCRTVWRNRDYASALRLYERAAAVGDRNAHGRYNYGLLAQRAGRLAVAEREYHAALVFERDHSWALAGLAEVLYLRERFDEALTYSDRAVVAEPDSWRVHYDRAVILEALGRGAAALESYAVAETLAPESFKVRAALVRALVQAQRYDDARALCDRPRLASSAAGPFAALLDDQCRAVARGPSAP